jgi:exodeoxyribonuclease VII large subunit
VHRPVELGRERLEARVRRMPRAEALLQPQAQRLDDLSERLRRGLTDRARQGREELVGVSSRLSPRLLTGALSQRRDRLERVRLTPALVQRPIDASRERLAALARLASQLHPEKPLERGYAIVRDAQGKALTDKAQAAAEAALTLQFRDGELEVTVGDTAPPPKPPRKPRPAAPSPRQDDLFG